MLPSILGISFIKAEAPQVPLMRGFKGGFADTFLFVTCNAKIKSIAIINLKTLNSD
jgi:hypothetical protein